MRPRQTAGATTSVAQPICTRRVGGQRLYPGHQPATRAYTSMSPGSFNWQHVHAQFINNAQTTQDEKLSVLRELLEKGGSSAPLIAAYPQRMATAAGGLKGDYYATRDLSGRIVLTRVDPVLNHPGGKPAPNIAQENWSVRWTGRIVPRYSETYYLHAIADDGVRLWIGNKLLIDDWTDHGATEAMGTIELKAATPYDIKIEYYQGQGDGTFQLLWSSKSQKRELVPQSCLLPGTALVAGESAAVRMTMCSGA